MFSFLQTYHRRIYIWSLMLLAASLALAPFFMTLAQIFLLANWICERGYKEKINRLLGNKAAIAIMGIYALHLLGLAYTNDFGYAAKDLWVKLPILILPLTIGSIPVFTKKEFDSVLYSFLGGMLLGTCISLYIFFGFTGIIINYNTYSGSQIQQLSPMISHIRYSLMMCVAAFVALHYYLRSNGLTKIFWGVLTIWLVFFLAFLGVRSGLLAFFAAAFTLIVYQILIRKKLLGGVLLLVGICLMPILFYKNITMFRLGVDEVRWELGYYKEGGKPSGHSIPQRFAFWKASKEIIAKNPLLGVGTGDIVKAYDDYYKANPSLLDTNSQYRSHNQYLSITVAFGLIGLAVFLFSVFFPFFYTQQQGHITYMAFFVTFIVSMLIEDTIETQAGATFFAFFAALFVKKTAPNLEKQE